MCVALLLSTAVSTTLQQVLYWFAHLFSPHLVKQYESIILGHRESIFERKSLMNAYSNCVHLLHSISDNYFKNVQGQIASLCPMAEQLVQNQVIVQGYFGYHTFVAYFREVYLVCAVYLSAALQIGCLGLISCVIYMAKTVELVSPLCGEWIFQPTKSCLEFKHKQFDELHGYLDFDVCCNLNTFVYVPHLCTTSYTLQSKWSLYPCQQTRFEIDRQPHIFRLFPNSKSTLSGNGPDLGTLIQILSTYILDGDYVSWQTIDGKIVLECYHYELLVSNNWRITFQISKQGENIMDDMECNLWHAQLDEGVAFRCAALRIALWGTSSCQLFGRAKFIYTQVLEQQSLFDCLETILQNSKC
ncbi:hypothetical protein THRCLA_21033 [Thraustotheca clavata]|uniref:Uncharacterized protein n=1 Tax=Thraustotheca clavata TaxID=74557 RepID=A0A1W0A135_9STRA|nr:hypothetical protein THRCLA_21033 [Thraustotheca clavata]